MTKQLIEKYGDESGIFRIPGMVRTKKGTLLAYYECRSDYSDWAEIDIKIIRSIDDGKTWSTVKIIKGEGETLNNPVMIVNDEEIHFLYLQNYKRLFTLKSTDDGLSFSEMREITDAVSEKVDFYNCIAVGPGHGIVHRGVMLIPMWICLTQLPPTKTAATSLASML